MMAPGIMTRQGSGAKGAALNLQETLDLAPFKKLMLLRCGFSFENDRAVTLETAVRQRMQLLKSGSADGYLAQLGRDRLELDRLVELLTVNETYFFREPAHLRLLMDRLLPEVRGTGGATVKILSAGCSTGEEPYSVAMMLREAYGSDCEQMFSVVGVDIDAAVIAKARQGLFGPGSFRGVDQGIRGRYFEPCANGASRLRAEVRGQVEFAVVNLLGPGYPDLMQQPDIILYRNVSIYFPKEVQREIFRQLAGLLRQGGYLLVGATETMHHDIGILSLVKEGGLFVYRKVTRPASEERRKIAGLASEEPRKFAGLVLEARRKMQRSGEVAPRGGSAPTAAAAPARRPVRQEPWGKALQVQPMPLARAIAPQQNAAPGVEAAGRSLFDAALAQACGNGYQEALAILAPLIAQDGASVKAHALQGSILVQLGRFDEARSACQRALELDPLCIEAQLMLGIIGWQLGDNEQALRQFRKSIYLDPDCWLAHFYLAEIMFAAGDQKRARVGYQNTARILENGSPVESGREVFPLSFQTEQFLTICRHKLSLLQGGA
jgi:chemotaxis protein methyltransferase CheR